MITVHGRKTSSNVQVVMWALAELGLDGDVARHDVGGAFGGTDTPDYRAKNPNGRIPVLEDDRVTLFESPAILRYLAARHGDGAFRPTDPALRAPLDMWAEWMKTSFCQSFATDIFWPLIRTRAADRDPAQIARGVASLKALAPMLDARIGAGPWLAGDSFSFADVMCGHILYRYYTVDFDRAETPQLRAYYDRLTGRPAYATHVMVSYESLRVA